MPYNEGPNVEVLMNVALPETLQDYITAKVRSGEYADEADVVCEALRLMEEHEAAKLEALEAALEEGLASGPAEPFDRAAFVARMEARGRQSS